MRKIEKEMLMAIATGTNWHKDNTQVFYDKNMDITKVYLHGHVIARIIGQQWTADIQTLRRYPTNTTKSRLRALGFDVFTRKGITYLQGQEV